jgi:hypothetical protein
LNYRRNPLWAEMRCASGSAFAPAFEPAFRTEAIRDRMASIEFLVRCGFTRSAVAFWWAKCL